jgi:predicted amidophosphoribosyltransferase
MVVECPACQETIESVMQVNCRACGAPLRPAELWGGVIRRKAEPASAPLISLDDL